MSHQLQVTDRTTGGAETDALTLDFLTERITVEELIRSRVFQEVKDHNARSVTPRFRLVEPADTTKKQIDWQEQFAVALDAFRDNRFLVLVDDRQVDDLADEIVVAPSTRVSFLKLVPLVGG